MRTHFTAGALLLATAANAQLNLQKLNQLTPGQVETVLSVVRLNDKAQAQADAE